MMTTTRILHGTEGWIRADEDALTNLYEAHGGAAPADLPGLLDWARAKDAPLVTIAIESSTAAPSPGARVFDAAVLLTHRRVAGISTVRLAGHGWADQQVVCTRTHHAATQLAAAVVIWLGGLGRWRLDLEQLPDSDPFVDALGALCPSDRLESGDPLPYLTWAATRTATNWAPKKFRQQSRQAQRRLTQECGEPSILTLDTTDEVLDHLGGYHEVFDARERELGRPSAIRDPAIAATKEAVLRRLGDQHLLQAWELRVGTELIAYYITLQVGSTRRMWDGRMTPGLAHVSPGTILMAHVLQTWHGDPSIERVDFMRGSNEFKKRLSAGEVGTQRLRAWSTPGLAGAETALTTADHHTRRVIRTARDRSPALAGLIRRLR
ncbi:GNAT family N-acetyltransferase [Dermatophilaceae bacterium Sec6.4]